MVGPDWGFSPWAPPLIPPTPHTPASVFICLASRLQLLPPFSNLKVLLKPFLTGYCIQA